MSVEILIYAVIAGVLVFWLKNTLGTTHGEERERPNPLTQIKQDSPANSDTGLAAGNALDNFDMFNSKKTNSMNEDWTGLPIRDAAFTGLNLIAASDRKFNVKQFLAGAKDAFPLIVESFAEGDKDSLSRFLAAPLYKNFARAIDDRTARGESVKTDIHAVRQAEIVEADIRDRTAFITIRFKAEETSIVYNKEGVAVSGHPDRVTELNDIWIFGRDIKSQDPTWFLYETRDDIPEEAPSIFPHSA